MTSAWVVMWREGDRHELHDAGVEAVFTGPGAKARAEAHATEMRARIAAHQEELRAWRETFDALEADPEAQESWLNAHVAPDPFLAERTVAVVPAPWNASTSDEAVLTGLMVHPQDAWPGVKKGTPDRIRTIKAVREMTGCSLKEAVELVRSIPQPLGVSLEHPMVQAMREAGATFARRETT